MNLPNRLTVGRFFLTVLFVVCLSATFPFSRTAALVLFTAAGLTDYMDGEIARRCMMVTDFGKLMDPLVDKIMMAAAFICLVERQAVPAWVAIAIISRDFLITGLRLLALSKGKLLPADRMGKHKTVWQIVTVSFFLCMMALSETFHQIGSARWWVATWRYGGVSLIACALGFTLYSGLGYMWKNRGLITAEVP